jgi:hypothetical protein
MGDLPRPPGGRERRITLHGFGSFPAFFRHVIELARSRDLPIAWSVILPTPHFLEPMREVLPPDAVLDVYAKLDLSAAHPTPERVFASYPGNIHADIEAEKHHLKHRPAAHQIRYAAALYLLYKRFLTDWRTTDVLFASLEGFEGKMLTRVAAELGVRAIVPTGLRNLGGIFFSPDANESLPRYARPTSECRAEASRLIARFRESPTSAVTMLRDPEQDGPPLSDFARPFVERARGALARHLSRPDLFDRAELRPALLNNLPMVRDGWRAIRQGINVRVFDIPSVQDLPSRFVYYPLQMTPETSINAPAPFFVDQLRAIDALRFAMPNDATLVVKEHWASVMVRPTSFLRSLTRRSGVRIIRYNEPSIEIIRRASLTVTVTGTAAFEAFLLGRPSLLLGAAFFAPFIGGVAATQDLRARIEQTLDQGPSDDAVLDAVAMLLAIRCDATYRAPGWAGEPVLRPGNIARFLDGLLDHVQRDHDDCACEIPQGRTPHDLPRSRKIETSPPR